MFFCIRFLLFNFTTGKQSRLFGFEDLDMKFLESPNMYSPALCSRAPAVVVAQVMLCGLQ